MRKHFVCLVCIFFVLITSVSCESNYFFNGAWTYKEAYDYWKSGKSEELSATKSKIGNDYYLVLTNSLTIRVEEDPMIFAVPGGSWKIIGINKVTENKYSLIMESSFRENTEGEIFVHKIDNRNIYFTRGKMSEGFEKEINRSFLLFGEENASYRCDIVSE